MSQGMDENDKDCLDPKVSATPDDRHNQDRIDEEIPAMEDQSSFESEGGNDRSPHADRNSRSDLNGYIDEAIDSDFERSDSRKSILESVDIGGSTFRNTVFGAENVTYNNFEGTVEDPTYPATVRSVTNSARFHEQVNKTKQMLVHDHIVFLQTSSFEIAKDPLHALCHELSIEYSLRVCESSDFDWNFFRYTKTAYETPSVTYVDLLSAPLYAHPLMQADYATEIQRCLKKQNNHLILVVGKEAFEDANSLQAASNLHRWKIETLSTESTAKADAIPDNPHASALTYVCAFFPGLDIAETDRLMTTLLGVSDSGNAGDTPTKKKDKKKDKCKQTQTWETRADEIARANGIAYQGRENESVGYYFVEVEREEQMRSTLISDYPQYVMRKTALLLTHYFSADRLSRRFFSHFLELLIFLEQRRSSVLEQATLLATFSERVLIDQNGLALNRFCLLVRHLDRHPTTRLVVDALLSRQLARIRDDLEHWDQIVTAALGEASPALDEVHGWLLDNDAALQDYNTLIQRVAGTYILLIAGVDWRSGRNIELVHELTLFKRHQNTNAHYICNGFGLFALYEHLFNNWQNIESYGKLILERHKNKNKPRADVMLDAFNMAIRQIFNNCVFNNDWQAARDLIAELQRPKSCLAETIAEVTLTRTPYKPSKTAITLALTEYGPTMTIQEYAPKKDMAEIAHFYEQLTRALVRYTDEFTEHDGDRKRFLREIIRVTTGPLMSRLKNEQRRELREALRSMQGKHKAYRAQHTKIKRGSKRHDMQLLIAEAIRMLLGNLRMSRSKEEPT